MIIFLYGDDSFRSGEKLKEIKEKFIRSDSGGTGLSVLDFSEKPDGEAITALGSLGLFSSKRLVVIKNFILSASKEKQDEMREHLKKNKSIPTDNDLVIVFWEENIPRKNNSLFKFLDNESSGSKRQNFEKLVGKKLEQWVLKKISEKGSKISQSALNKLLVYVGNDSRVLNNEINKLVDFCLEKAIDEKAVEMLVKSSLDGNIFATIDALAENNKAKAAKFLQEHLEKGDDPFYLFSMFIYQFRNLIKINGFLEKKNTSEYEISKMAKLHPFVVKKSLAQLRNFPSAKLKAVYNKLADLDLKIKTGKIDIKLALQKFIVEL